MQFSIIQQSWKNYRVKSLLCATQIPPLLFFCASSVTCLGSRTSLYPIHSPFVSGVFQSDFQTSERFSLNASACIWLTIVQYLLPFHKMYMQWHSKILSVHSVSFDKHVHFWTSKPLSRYRTLRYRFFWRKKLIHAISSLFSKKIQSI